MPSREDQLSHLLVRLGEGDDEAMQELFLLERSSLHRFFMGLGRCAGLAEDLVQGTFLNLWRYRRGFNGRGSAAAYLNRVAINQWRQSYSKEKRRGDAWRDLVQEWNEGTPRDASSTAEGIELAYIIWEAIDALPNEQREVFLLHRHQGLSCPEIAEATQTNLKTVESRLRLGLKKLVERLAQVRQGSLEGGA